MIEVYIVWREGFSAFFCFLFFFFFFFWIKGRFRGIRHVLMYRDSRIYCLCTPVLTFFCFCIGLVLGG